MAKEEKRTGPWRAPTGTRDVLPPESAAWEEVVGIFAAEARLAGFGLALTPLFEEAGVFSRGVGTSTDIVRKEMYEFEDKGGRAMALRPEATASVVRAFIEHRPAVLPWKVWYGGPMFRYERPQAGRYRQFYQLGAEVVGTDDPEADVEVIALLWDFFAKAGIARKSLRVNSLGDAACRPVYRESLRTFLSERADRLCPEHRDRYEENPLRVLDCKKPECVAATQGAPRQGDSLCEECRVAMEQVLRGLVQVGIPAVHDPRLVRGLDYYTRTTFEIVADALDAAQNAIGGGGRYDGLVEMLGGPPAPAVGFSIGIERMLLARETERVGAGEPGEGATGPADVFVVDLTGGREATLLARELREAGIAADRDFGGRSAKAQFKSADRSGARYALIIGLQEARDRTVTVKPLREEGEQFSVPREEIVATMKERLT